jgi:hypothetical protein
MNTPYRNFDNLPSKVPAPPPRKYGEYYTYWNYISSMLVYHLANDSISPTPFGFLVVSNPNGHRIESQLRRTINDFIGIELGEVIQPGKFTADVEDSWRNGFAISRYIEISRPLEEKLIEKANLDPLGTLAFIETLKQKFKGLFSSNVHLDTDEIGKHLNLQGATDGN